MKSTIFKMIILINIFSINNSLANIDKKLEELTKKFNMTPLGWPAKSSQAEVKLGASLFFEKALSGNNNISCAGCHAADKGLGDAIPLSLGQGMKNIGSKRTKGNGAILARNAPHLFNIGYDEQAFQFWDGRVHYNEEEDSFNTPSKSLNGASPKSFEIKIALTHSNSAQALFPILSHEEMLGTPGQNKIAGLKTNELKWQALVNKLLKGRKSNLYKAMFQKAFPDIATKDINIGHVAEAIYAFEKHAFVINNTPWDKYLRGEKEVLSLQEKRGAIVFMDKGRCAECHNGPHLSNFEFKNIAIPPIGPGKTKNKQDYGRFNVTKNELDKFKFKTPALRNVALTGPYMHNGALTTLDAVVNHYDHVRHSFMHYSIDENVNKKFRTTYESDIKRVFVREEVIDMFSKLDKNVWPPLSLTKVDKEDLLTFLKKSLTQPVPTYYKPWVK